MSEGRDADLFEVLVGQVTQNSEINIVLSKTLNILVHTELFEPVRNLLHSQPAGIDLRQVQNPQEVVYILHTIKTLARLGPARMSVQGGRRSMPT
jgi:hypothetical protein